MVPLETLFQEQELFLRVNSSGPPPLDSGGSSTHRDAVSVCPQHEVGGRRRHDVAGERGATKGNGYRDSSYKGRNTKRAQVSYAVTYSTVNITRSHRMLNCNTIFCLHAKNKCALIFSLLRGACKQRTDVRLPGTGVFKCGNADTAV